MTGSWSFELPAQDAAHLHLRGLLRLVGVRPCRAVRLSEALQAHPGCVDGALTLVHEDIIQEATEGSAKERTDHGDLQHIISNALKHIEGFENRLTQK